MSVIISHHDFDAKPEENLVQNGTEAKIISSKTVSEEVSEDDTKCGLLGCAPAWLQVFASKKSIVIAYTLVLTILYAINAYFMGTITTIEKNYKMSSKMIGSIKGSAEIGSLLFNFILTYLVGKGHKGRWLAIGMTIAGISSFLRIMPYIVYGPGDNAKMYTNEYNLNFTNMTLGEDECDEYVKTNEARNFAFRIFLIAQITIEVAGILLKIAGGVYLDDNTRKNVFPFLFTITQAMRSFGATLGFMLASYTLEIFVNPKLTPKINKKDPRWIGAWWLGWILIGGICFVVTIFLLLFPRTLPRAALRKKQLKLEQENTTPSVKDFFESTRRILKNKLVLLDSFSSICFKIGLAAYEIFLPKYIESQFGLSASKSNFLAGFVALIGKSFGIVIIGLVMTFYRPSPRSIMASNVVIGASSVFVHFSYLLINCPEQKIQGHWNRDHIWNTTEQCNTNDCVNTKYSPVCDQMDRKLYFSACHAGCSESPGSVGIDMIYKNCTCVSPSSTVVSGPCIMECSSSVVTFLIILGFFRLIRMSIKSFKKIIRYRYVDKADKSLSLGINKALLSLLAAFPSPILYGYIIDWACVIFERTCGKSGNCWLYDVNKLRYTLNLTATGFLVVGTILDGFLWYFVKDLKIYDEHFQNDEIDTNAPDGPERETMIPK